MADSFARLVKDLEVSAVREKQHKESARKRKEKGISHQDKPDPNDEKFETDQPAQLPPELMDAELSPQMHLAAARVVEHFENMGHMDASHQFFVPSDDVGDALLELESDLQTDGPEMCTARVIGKISVRNLRPAA
jgi:hypothetical protein